jgi:hypothetical protein
MFVKIIDLYTAITFICLSQLEVSIPWPLSSRQMVAAGVRLMKAQLASALAAAG